MAKGVTEAVLEREQEAYQRQCHVYGAPFDGLDSTWSSQSLYEKRELRVLVVHGAGDYRSGYSDAMGYELANRLGLTRVDARPKEVPLNRVNTESNPNGSSEPMGNLHVTRFRNAQDNRQLLIFELSWGDITREDKNRLAFDESTAMTAQRVLVNKQLKAMVNMHASDPLIYIGPTGEKIRRSVRTAMCLLTNTSWNALGNPDDLACYSSDDPSHDKSTRYAIITHSMGSRIVIDVIRNVVEEPDARYRASQRFKDAELNVYMLSNQLQLIQLGFSELDHRIQKGAYCHPSDSDYEQRLTRSLNLISITDPNDIFSYTVPQSFVDDFVDARLCPRLVNVVTEVAAPVDVFGIGGIAEPMEAHKSYFTDHKVLDVIVFGLNGALSSDDGHTSCLWNDVVEQ